MAVRQKNTSRKSKSKIISFLQDERVKLIISLSFIGFAVLLVFSFISYFFTWKADQSFQFQTVVSSSDIQVDNWAGKVGAELANIFIKKWFGVASFSIPFILVVIGLHILNKKIIPLYKSIRIALISTIILSLLLGYLLGNMKGYLGSGLGGDHGYFMSQWLNSFMGKLGTGIFLLVVVVTFIVFTIPGSVLFFKQMLEFMIPVPKDRVEFDNASDELATVDTTIKDEIKQENQDELGFIVDRDNKADALDNKQDEQFEIEKNKEEDELSIVEKDDELQDTEDNEDENDEDDLDDEDEIEEDVEITVLKGEGDELEEDEISNEEMGDYDPTLELSSFKLPPLDLLDKHESANVEVSNEELISNKNKIVETLGNYKIVIDKIKATIGPTVTLYEIVPAPGIRIAKIKSLEDDIALSLAALGIRIIAPMPGKGTIGIEVPNMNPQIVSMRTILSSRKFQEAEYELPVALGKTISNETYVFDLAKLPHLLVAGATGQGKSVGLNAIISSLIYKKHPAQLKFVFIDPKKVELSVYSKLENHYLAKLPDTEEAIITDTQKVITTLNSLTVLMDQRYDLLKKAKVRNIKEYNGKFISRRLNPNNGHHFMPYVVLVIDEFADLIMTAGKEIENPIARLAQLARAIGIHLIIATQRPTTNIITGVIKANFPARIAFRVMSMIDSRTILDTSGANQLIGRGDMLITSGSELVRLQCAFVDTPEIERVTDFISNQQAYPSAYMLPEYVGNEDGGGPLDVDLNKKDALFEDAARLVVIHQQGSASLIQRKFSIGYARAGRIIDQLEAAGIVGSYEGSKARQVLFSDEYSLEKHLNNLNLN